GGGAGASGSPPPGWGITRRRRGRGQRLVHRLMGTLTVEPSQDLLRRLDPNEGLAPFIPAIEEALDGVDECLHAGEDSASDGTAAQESKTRFRHGSASSIRWG